MFHTIFCSIRYSPKRTFDHTFYTVRYKPPRRLRPKLFLLWCEFYIPSHKRITFVDSLNLRSFKIKLGSSWNWTRGFGARVSPHLTFIFLYSCVKHVCITVMKIKDKRFYSFFLLLLIKSVERTPKKNKIAEAISRSTFVETGRTYVARRR